MPPPEFGWTQCNKVYCGQYWMIDIANRNAQAVCPNCLTAFWADDSEGPPEPPELMAMAGTTSARGAKKTRQPK